MIEALKLINPQALFKHSNLFKAKPVNLTECNLTCNGHPLVLTFEYEINEKINLYIKVSFVSLKNLKVNNFCYENPIQSYQLQDTTFFIGNSQDFYISFDYEWAQIEGITEIQLGEF